LTLKNTHLLCCHFGFCAQHTQKYASLEALLRLASVQFLSVNFTYNTLKPSKAFELKKRIFQWELFN